MQKKKEEGGELVREVTLVVDFIGRGEEGSDGWYVRYLDERRIFHALVFSLIWLKGLKLLNYP